MSLLLLSLFATPADASLCTLDSELTLELRDLAEADPLLLVVLLGPNASAAEQDLGQALEALMVVAEDGAADLIDQFSDIVLSKLGDDLDPKLQDQIQDLVDNLREADTETEREAAFLAAAEVTGFEPLPDPEPIAPVTSKPETDTVVMVTPENAGPSYSGLLESGTPIKEVTNDYEGGYEAGLAQLWLVMGQPGAYSNEFFDGYSAGQDEAWERR